MGDIVRISRILEYEGPRKWVEDTLSKCAIPINGERRCSSTQVIRSAIIGSFATILHSEYMDQVRGLIECVAINSEWKHTNGNKYKVTGISNGPDIKEGHPIDVIYYNVEGQGPYTRPITDWFRSFEQINPDDEIPF